MIECFRQRLLLIKWTIFLLLFFSTNVAFTQADSENSGAAETNELSGHWRLYYADHHELRCTLTFSDSTVFINKYRLSLRGTSKIHVEDDVIYFGDEFGDYFGEPSVKNDTLFIKHFDYNDEITGYYYGLKATGILPEDLYDFQNLQVELKLPEENGTILNDSLLIWYADIVVGKAKKNYQQRRIKKGDVCIQVNDVIIEKEDIGRYIAQERDKLDMGYSSSMLNKSFLVKLHVHKDISQEFIETLVTTTDLRNHRIYQAFFDENEGSIGFLLIHDGAKEN